jgi:hypothetical protein
MSDFQRALDAMPHPPGEPFPGETYIADGWVYRDLPKMTQEAFNTFLDILGEENAKWMTFARYPDKSVRGQFLMSPAGMDRLKAHSAASRLSSEERS